MKRRFVWAATIVVAALGTAGGSALETAGVSPTPVLADNQTALTAAGDRDGVRCGPGRVVTIPVATAGRQDGWTGRPRAG